MSGRSLRLRLLLGGAVFVLAALALAALGLTLLFERHVERRVLAELGVHLDQLVAAIGRDASGALVIARSPGDPRFAQPLSGLYWQVEAEGTVLRSRSLWDERLSLPADHLADGAVHEHRVAGPGGAELVAVERSVTLPSRLGGGTLRAVVAVDGAELTAATRAFAAELLPYLALLALALTAAAYLQVAVGLRPLAGVRRRLGAIKEGRAHRLGEAPWPDEIRPLAAEVDALLEAREEQVERARARAGDLAHGLKTPLQVLAGDAERLRGRGESAIADEIESLATAMRRHVDRELARARLAAGSTDARAPIAAVVERVVAVAVRTPAGAGLSWSVEVPDEIIARIDPDDLAEAIGNLVENAARHARTRVSVVARAEGGRALIAVVDDGPGIPPDKLDVVLARGGRLDSLGSGAGLGLAIVRDIAEAWGGELHLRSGPGLAAELSVRLAA